MCCLGDHKAGKSPLVSSRTSSSRGSKGPPAPDAEGLLQAQAHHSEEVVHPLLVVCHDAHVGGGTIAGLQAHHAAAQCVQAADLHHCSTRAQYKELLCRNLFSNRPLPWACMKCHASRSRLQVLLLVCSSLAHQ